MNVHEARAGARERMRFLLIILTLSATVRFVGPVFLTKLESLDIWIRTRLKPWVTEPLILERLQQSSAYHPNTSGESADYYSLELRNGRITALKYWARNPDSIAVQFDFEQDGKRYRIDGIIPYEIIEGDAGGYHEERLGALDSHPTLIRTSPSRPAQ